MAQVHFLEKDQVLRTTQAGAEDVQRKPRQVILDTEHRQNVRILLNNLNGNCYGLRHATVAEGDCIGTLGRRRFHSYPRLPIQSKCCFNKSNSSSDLRTINLAFLIASSCLNSYQTQAYARVRTDLDDLMQRHGIVFFQLSGRPFEVLALQESTHWVAADALAHLMLKTSPH